MVNVKEVTKTVGDLINVLGEDAKNAFKLNKVVGISISRECDLNVKSPTLNNLRLSLTKSVRDDLSIEERKDQSPKEKPNYFKVSSS